MKVALLAMVIKPGHRTNISHDHIGSRHLERDSSK